MEAEQKNVPKKGTKIVAFDYIRSFVILLVLVHHTILSYVTFSQPNPYTPFTFAPVVDSQKWSFFDLITLYNDTWFMALLFFISGLFVIKSLTGKGVRIFMRDRFIRLGIPFVVGTIFLIPLAYFPGQLQIDLIYGGSTSYLDFWLGMVRSGFGTAGPLWFVGVLLIFDGIITAIYLCIPHLNEKIGLRTSNLLKRPKLFFLAFLGLSSVAYIPMILAFGAGHMSGVGPLKFQTSRIFLYLVYFLFGTLVGAFGLERGIFCSDGLLAKQWGRWVVASIISFFAWFAIVIFISYDASVLALPVFCMVMLFSVTSFFLRFTKGNVALLDNLSKNSYGIYIFHYVFMTWLQFVLLQTDFHAIQKASIVFALTLILSWGTTSAIRRIPTVARVI
ncbi:MAG: acyltransferase [Halobacteriota archaeon]|nr:acyltransferase [Halobacteriota archaeon]